MIALESLSVEGFRGIVRSSLPFEGGSIVLGGGNGTGKTAFVDAIEFLFTGTVGSLTGTAGLSLRQHGAHVHATPGSSCVSATFTSPPGTITRLLTGPIDMPTALDAFLIEGQRVSFVLRRAQLQEFIHARPADRYRQLADLIGADVLDKTESALKRAHDTLARSLTDAENEVQRLERRLTEIPDEVSEAEILAEVTTGLNDLGFGGHELASLEDIAKVRGGIVRSLARPEPDPRDLAQQSLRMELGRGIGVDHLLEVIGAYRMLLPAKRDSGPPDSTLDLLQILQRGKQYLRDTEPAHCPLCEHDIESRALLTRLVQRVANLEEVSLQQQRLDRARGELQVSLQDVSARARALERVQKEAGVTARATPGLVDALTMVQETLRAGAAIEQLEMTARLEDSAQRWLGWKEEVLATIPDPRMEAEPEGSDSADRALSLLQYAAAQIAQGTRGRDERDRIERELAVINVEVTRRHRAVDLARVTYSTYNHVKNDAIQGVFDELRSDLVRYYDFLHPGEGHSALSIAMDPRKRGSSDLRMGFYDRRDEDPRAFGSEGHLDSLGLCIFLAFARRFNGDWPALVLDDVVSSVDTAHKRRVAALLFQEFGNRQLFITTHDSRWFAELQRAEIETGQAHRVKNFVIEGWSLEEGPKLKQMQ